MKKFKKLIALTCVAAMLVPTVAFAADPTSETGDTYTGNSVIENDNSVEPEYTAVELPTINAGTYDFSIDRDHLLADFDYVSTYDSNSYIYFKAEDDAATAVNKAEDGSLYLAEIENVADTSAFLGKFSSATLTGVLGADDEYYVWVPTEADKTRGEFIAIGDAEAEGVADVANIVEWSDNDTPDETGDDKAILREDHDSGNFIWDGNIYQKVYNKLSATEAVKYITVTDGAVDDVDENLYVATGTEATVEKTAVTAATKDDITYTAATTQYIDESDSAKVVNKSTTPVVVSVKVDMKDDEGLTYVDATDLASDTNASLYFAIEDEYGNAAVVEDSTATAYYVLAGAVNGTTKYQGKADDLNQATGSHNYYQYENPYPTYAEHSFKLVADVNEAQDADEKWQEYVDSLTADGATAIKPTIEVVYSWEVVEKTETANVYTDLAGENLYTTDGSTGWASGEAATEPKLTFTADENVTWKNNGANTGYYCTGTSVSVTSANAYLLDSDSKYTTSSAIDISSAVDNSNTAVVKLTIATLKELLTEPGTYGIIIVADEVTYNTTFTISE